MADKTNERIVPSGSLGRRLIFWEFARASWQYDVVVALILVFIFATPRDWFRDQPRASSIILMSSQHGLNSVYIAPDLLEGLPESQRASRAQLLIQQRTGKSWHVARVEPIRDEAAQEIKGFIAYTDQALNVNNKSYRRTVRLAGSRNFIRREFACRKRARDFGSHGSSRTDL